jgi:hypothetical protein
MGSLRSSHGPRIGKGYWMFEELWGRYAPVMARETFLCPISFKPKPYQNDETIGPKSPTSNWSKTPVPIPSAYG